ncbi:CAP domain-containing protein [Desulfosporosinus sp. FKA]|uniref:CAP domain-containing protein n=1 Tax=Desulfosporosinus sp. FKA TaxID=1969834 RepID=UPI000B49CEA9|nr:CAP domain-containing protein [Desulfosporosinus sp. FKA]
MNKRFKVFAGIQMALLMTTIAMPAQAALLIGGSQSLPGSASGSVVTLRSTAPAATQVVSAPTTTTTASGTQSTTSVSTTPSTQNSAPTVNTLPTTTNSSSVVSLKNIYPTSIPSTSVTVPTSTQGTGTSTNYSSTPSTVQYQPVTVTIGQPSLGGSVVSLKNINQSSSSVPVTSTPPTSNTSPTSSSSSPTTTPTTPAIPAVTSLTPDEQQMVDMINQERAAAGVAPLKVDFRLVSVGQAKADDMKANNYFDHTSPTYGSPWAMMQEVGLTVGWAGENIAGNDSVSGAMAAFMQSPGHKANILDPRFTHVGVGIAYGSAYGNLYVQEFLQE